ncbi:hypothetical protein [Chitinimonas sp. JJ19]|uniref:hypothetical protein n=1 Tax=Chitinimonas sp. JJ19 TaxID=3109352 RepID=UPI003001C285
MIDPYSVSHHAAQPSPSSRFDLPILATFCITISALFAVVMLLVIAKTSLTLLQMGLSFSVPVIAQHIQYGAIFYAFWCAMKKQHSPAKPLILAVLMTVPAAMLQRYDLINNGGLPPILVAAPIILGLITLPALASCARQAKRPHARQDQPKA